MNAAKYKILQGGRGIQANSQQKVRVESDVDDDELILYTKQQFADILQIKVSTVSAWITQGRLRRIKVGTCTRISRAELKRFLRDANEPDARTLSDNEDRARMRRVARRALSSLARLEAFEDVCDSTLVTELC